MMDSYTAAEEEGSRKLMPESPYDGNNNGNRNNNCGALLAKISPSFIKYSLLALSLAGLVGFIVQLSYLNVGSPLHQYNAPYVTGTWLSFFLYSYSQCGYLASVYAPYTAIRIELYTIEGCCSTSYCKALRQWFWRNYYANLLVVSVLLMIGYFEGYRPDGGAWALFLAISCFFNLLLDRRLQDSCNTAVEADYYDTKRLAVAAELTFRQRFVRKNIEIARVLKFVLTGMLLGGCFLQMSGYNSFPPEGKFVTITYDDGTSINILTNCEGPYNSSVPTIWVEVGGGGHSMSDLWGLRDYITTNYNRRYCSYDMPGTGHSSYSSNRHQGYITQQVMDAMNEPGPFICLGSMDDGDIRCLEYCVNYPSNCRAVVPVSFGSPSEFQLHLDFYGGSRDAEVAAAKSALQSRMTSGNLINFFGVSWGLIAALIPDGNYVPKDRAYESHFLNVFNEKQWITNSNILYYLWNHASDQVSNSKWMDAEWGGNLSLSIPVFGFTLGQTDSQLDDTCRAYGYKTNSKDCDFVYYTYETTISCDQEIVARNPNSRLFICFDECNDANGNSFVINQENMIPWFADTLFQKALFNITSA